MEKKECYTIGLDFGSLSVRAVLLNLANGQTVDSDIFEYENKIITDKLPGTNIKLENNWALQDPDDYINGLIKTIKTIVDRNKQIRPEQIIGIGIDFTSCTVLPTLKDGTPLCNIEKFRKKPHSWVKLWKHHAAEDEANEITKRAFERDEKWIHRYGGKISSEWLFPKLLQILNEDEEIYDQMDRFIEATDWIVWQLTSKEKRNMITAGFKAIYSFDEGFPSKDYFKSLHPKFENVIEEKIGTTFYKSEERAGYLNSKFSKLLGLTENTAIAIGQVDAHVSIASTKVVDENNMLMIMGTSTCDIVNSKKEYLIDGICGSVKNAVIDNFYTYESGQNAVGDMFAWFIDNCVPSKYFENAKKENLNIHKYLTKKASFLKPGQSGLIALDWINGNRTILVDNNLTCLILGLQLDTKPEEIYRALIEATAFGKKRIIDEYEKNSLMINKVTMCGGLPHKNDMLNQIYADILNKELFIASELQAPAVSSAMYGAVAAGPEIGGFKNIVEASQKIGNLKDTTVIPNQENVKKYAEIYNKFLKVHDFFGKENKQIMYKLKELKKGYEQI